MDQELITKYVNWVYSVYPECDERTLLDDLIEKHTSEKLGEIFGIDISEELHDKVIEAMEKYRGQKLYCYCCGDLFPLPPYHGDAFQRFIEDTVLPIEEVFSNVSSCDRSQA